MNAKTKRYPAQKPAIAPIRRAIDLSQECAVCGTDDVDVAHWDKPTGIIIVAWSCAAHAKIVEAARDKKRRLTIKAARALDDRSLAEHCPLHGPGCEAWKAMAS